MTTPTTHPPPDPTQGFSLLEVVMVLMLIGIMLVVAAPRWPDALLLDAQAQRLAQDIRYTQALTLNREQPHTLRWESGSRYTLVDAANQAVLPDPLPLEGVTMDPFSLSFTTPMGEPAAAYPPIHLSMGDASLTLVVTELTGTVRIQP